MRAAGGLARRAAWLGLAAAAVLLSTPAPAAAQVAAALRAKLATLEPRFADNPFGRPLALDSKQGSDDLRGDVYTRVEHPYPMVEQALKSIDNWCDILILHLNVKRCRSVDASGKPQIALEVGRKFDQPIEQAHRLDFDYQLVAASGDYLQVRLTAPSGPFGTRDYRIEVEAVPVDARRTLIRMSYAYGYGFAARLAMQAYLATFGSGKVGFTVVSRGADGKPALVGGTVGLLERNTMRYYLAIDAFLQAQRLPAGERAERRIRTWWQSTERYAVQLHEMDEAEYLEMKRNEMRRQQTSAGPGAPAAPTPTPG